MDLQPTEAELQLANKLKIAYIIPRFYPFKGGAEQNIYALASRMAGEGHDVTVVTTDVKYRNEKLPKEEMIDGMKIVRHHALSESLYAGFYPELLTYLLSNKFDVIHVSGIGFVWREFCLIIKKIFSRKTKFIVTPQGQFMALNDKVGLRGFVKKFYTGVLRIFINWLFNIVIQVNPKQKAWMMEEYGIKSGKIRLIPNGIDQSYLESNIIEHEKGEKVTITYMNRMEFYKGIQDVIQALHIIKTEPKYKRKAASLPPFEFFIMGRAGNFTPKLKEQIERLKMEDCVEFVFAPTDEERDEIFYKQSQINILPSKWEATGITLIESMAKGNALITTYQNEAAYLLIKEGLNGYVFNFGDEQALAEILFNLLTDHKLLQSMREYNVKFAENFTWESVFPNYITLIGELVD